MFELNIVNYHIFNIFYKYNLYIILFNLLPIYPLDGFKIFNSIFENFFNFKCSIVLSLVVSIFFLVLFVIYLYIFRINNYIIVLFLLLSIFNYLKEFRYILNKFYIERILYDLDYNGFVSIRNINCMYKNKYNYINGINEKKVLKNKFNM